MTTTITFNNDSEDDNYELSLHNNVHKMYFVLTEVERKLKQLDDVGKIEFTIEDFREICGENNFNIYDL